MIDAKRSRTIACLAVGAALLALVLPFLWHVTEGMPGLWRDPYHDRNAHFLTGLNLALALKAYDPVAFFTHATETPVWPPLHAIALGFVLLAGGINPDIAIVPSLIAWTGTILMTAMLAFSAMGDRPAAYSAAVVGAALTAASPAFQLLGSDVMLEGLGAFLSACVLYAYTRASLAHGQRDAAQSERWCRWLAIALSALFLEKFNYWLMALAAVLATALVNGELRSVMRAAFSPLGWRLMRGCFGHPAMLAATVLPGAAIWLGVRGNATFSLLGRDFTLYPGLPLMVAWGLVLVRAALLWRAESTSIKAMLGRNGSILAAWHGLVVGLWFLVPNALGHFAWFVGPTHFGATRGYDPLAALVVHWRGFSEGFHFSPILAVAVVMFAAIGAVVLTGRGNRGRVIIMFAALSALIVVLHPHQQWRFQTTWLFAVWTLAGIGVAGMVQALLPRIGAYAAIAVAVAAVAGAAVLNIAPRYSEVALNVAIRTPGRPDDRALAAAYLPALKGVGDIGFASTIGRSDLFVWPVRVDCRCLVRVDQPWLDELPDGAAVRDAAGQWLAAGSAQRIVLVDMPAPYEVPGRPDRRGRLLALHDAFREQTRYERISGDLGVGDATVSVWAVTHASLASRQSAPARRHFAGTVAFGFALVAIAILVWPRRQA